jgi:hypothetical protein
LAPARFIPGFVERSKALLHLDAEVCEPLMNARLCFTGFLRGALGSYAVLVPLGSRTFVVSHCGAKA